MKIGDYVKYSNHIWEIILIEETNNQTYYKLECKSDNLDQIWVVSTLIQETETSQLYFNGI